MPEVSKFSLGKKFNLRSYLQDPSLGAGAFGGRRDPLRSQSGRIEYARRYGVKSQPLTKGEQVLASSPKGDLSQYNAFQAKEASDAAAKAEANRKKLQKQQEDRLAGNKSTLYENGVRTNEFTPRTPEEELAYREEQEAQRLKHAGNVLNTGKSLQEILEYQRGEGDYYRNTQARLSMMSPAEQEIILAQIKTMTDAADLAIWNMAEANQVAFATPEKYAEFRGYMASWLAARGTEAQELWDVDGLIGALAMDDIVPSPLSVLVDVGLLENDQILTKDEAAGISVDISSFTHEYGGDAELKVNVDGEGNVTLTVLQYLNADKTAVNEIPITNEEHRVRDFTMPQTLTFEQASEYMDITDGSEDALYIIQETRNEAGERALALVGQVIDGWTINFNEDGTRTYIDPAGGEYDQVGYDAFIATEEQKHQDAIDEFGGGLQGAVIVDLIATTDWRLGDESKIVTITEDGRAVVFPQSANWWKQIPQDADSYTTDERNNIIVTYTQEDGTPSEYLIPNPQNLPDADWVVTDTNGRKQIDISNTEGAQYFAQVYPMAFLDLVRSMGKTDSAVAWLKEDYGWTDEQINSFFEIRQAQGMAYDPETMQPLDIADSNNPLSFFNVLAASLNEVGHYASNDVDYVVGAVVDILDNKNQLSVTDRQDFVDYISTSVEDVAKAAAVSAVAIAAPPITGNTLLDTAFTANWRATSLGGAAARTYGIYTTAVNTADLVEGFIGAYANGNPEFGKQLTDAWGRYGLGMFFNNSIHEAVRNAGDVPSWLTTANEWAAAFAPMGWPTGLSRMWGMPIIFNRIRSGAFKLVKTIDSFETLNVVARYKGWVIQKVTDIPEYINRARGIFNDVVYVKGKPLEGGYLINTGREYVYVKDLKEAENFIRYGNKEGLGGLGSIPADYSGLTFDIGGQKFPLAELPNNLDIIAKAIKSNPGSLGRGWWGTMKSALKGRDVSQLSAEEITKIARDAIERGEISIEEIMRISKLLKIRKDEAIRGYLEAYKGWFRANAGDIKSMLPENENGEILRGVRLAEGAPDTLPSIGKSGLWASNTVAEYWKYFEFDNPKVKTWFSAAHDFIAQLNVLAEQEGITKGRRLYKEWTDTMGVLKEYFPRKVTGRADLGKKVNLPADFLKSREWQNAEEAIADGLQYANLEDALFSFASQVYKRIDAKQTASLLFSSGLIKPLLEETIAGRILKETFKKTNKYYGQTEILKSLINRVKRGERLSGANVAWLNKNFPEFVTAIKQLEYLHSDRALRDTLRDITNRLRARRELLRLDIRTLKTVNKETISELFVPIQTNIAKLRDYEGTLKSIIRGRLPSGISDDFITWLKESQIGQRIIPEIDKYNLLLKESVPMGDSLGALAIKNRQQAQLQVIIDEIASLCGALEEELAFFKGQSVETLTEKLTNPQTLIDRINTANSLIDQIWKVEKPQTKLGQLKEMLERNFPTEFSARIDDAISLADSSRAKDLYAELQNKALELIDEAKALKETAGIELKTAMDLLEKHNFEAVGHVPGVYNRIFDDIVVNGKRINGKDIYKMYEKVWKDKANPVLRVFEEVTRAILPLQLAVDLSGMLVQGLPMMGLDVANNLRVIAMGTGNFEWRYLKACEYYLGVTGTSMVDILGHAVYRNPDLTAKFLGAYRTKNRFALIDMVEHGGLINDGTDFFTGIGLWNKAIGKIPIEPVKRGLGAIASPYTASSVGFGAWGEIARIETYKSMTMAWKMGGGTKSELAEFCNIMTGSLLEPGRSANQIAFEAGALIAPRYYRANLIMLNRVMPVGWKYGGAKRGMTGKMILESLGGMVAGTVAGYVALCYASGQEPKLDFRPKSMGGDGSEAMTIKIGEYYVGVPGFWYGFIKACAGAIAIAQDNPDKVFTVDMDKLSESSAGIWLNWLSSKASPLVSLTREAITGRDFMGNRLDEGNDYVKLIYEQLVPVAWQSLTESDKPGRVEAWALNILGARSFPQSQWETFYNKVQDYFEAIPTNYLSGAQIRKLEAGTLSWGDLDDLQQARILDEHPELQPLYDAALAASQAYDTDEMRSWRTERETYDAQSVTAETNAEADLRDITNNETEGTVATIVDWRNAEKDISANNRRNSEDLMRRFPGIYELFDANDTDTATAFARAYAAWNDEVWNEDGLYDEYGNFLPEVLQSRKDAWMLQYGNFYDEMRELQRYGLKDDSPFKLFWWESRETIANCGYWDLTEGTARKEYRQNPLNVEADALLAFWGYTTTIQSAEAERIIRDWCEEYNIPESTIPALSALYLPEEIMTEYHITDKEEWRQFNAIEGTVTGWDKKWFLKEHREIYNYLIGEGLITEEINFAIVPDPDSHALIEAYNAIEGDNAETMRKMWRCTNEAGDAALVRYEGKSPLYGGNVCRVFLAQQGSGAAQASAAQQTFTGATDTMPINLPPTGNVSSEEEALRREANK